MRDLLLVVLVCINFPGYCFAELPAARQQELEHLLRHDCGSCHGLTLQGGLGPALTPERLATLPRELLLNTITYGRAGTPMPPWETLLTKEEISWLVDYLLQEEKK